MVLDAAWVDAGEQMPDPCGPETAGELLSAGQSNVAGHYRQQPCRPAGNFPSPGPSSPTPAAGLPTPPDPFFPSPKAVRCNCAEFATACSHNRGGGIGFLDLDGFANIALPVPVPGDKSYLLFTPDVQTHFVDGPMTPICRRGSTTLICSCSFWSVAQRCAFRRRRRARLA